MSRCENKVAQTVPSGWDYKTVLLRCGSTSVHGDPLECDECRAARKDKPRPGYCKHGVFINTDRDIPCGRCEMGD